MSPTPRPCGPRLNPWSPGDEGVLVIDNSTLAKLYSGKIELATSHWSGKNRQVISGINRITTLWTAGDLKISVDYRI